MRRRSPRHRRAALAAVAAVAVLALGACDSGDDKSAEPPSTRQDKGIGVIAPGAPGEPARTLSAEEAKKARPDNTPNSADFTYAQMMIVHHGQALEMTALVPERADSDVVKRLSARIAASQEPEIGAMEGWLESNAGAKKETGHHHGTMPGMATEAQLTRLRAAKGVAFDELFLKLMITHHQGAVVMATDAISDGRNIQIADMAKDVIAQQSIEIDRMRSM
ncbi:DUF305 domain-containing protein [Streptomyces paludis]|uniref:DUF305 domain-containing protein n=1 Tax=Streptomyces paludis TaxID=2282738 RepID=A0A345I014_9ACTN|nr:DUF305 domain-containing protein [Streptomyces paludis]